MGNVSKYSVFHLEKHASFHGGLLSHSSPQKDLETSGSVAPVQGHRIGGSRCKVGKGMERKSAKGLR